jgi:hypothetical protein
MTEEVVYTHRTGTLYDVLELILDRGLVIDAFVRISLVGIEIIKIDARIVVASVDTYLRFAEACNRLDLQNDSSSRTVPELFGGMSGGAASGVTKAGAKKAVSSVGDKARGAKEALTGGGEREKEPASHKRGRAADNGHGDGDGSHRSRRHDDGE